MNEDLGATAVLGSQLAYLYGGARYDGVLGMWYGKAPGVDRSGDILRHANFAGVGRNGGVLVLAGDDPQAKSSTLPTHSEVAFYDFQMPVLFPGSVQDILDLGRLGFELSRYSGLWVAVKMVTDVADAVGTAAVAPERIAIADPGFTYEGRPWEVRQPSGLLPPYTLDVEREIVYGRLEAARAFAGANGLNRITVPTPEAWLGVVAAGKAYYDLRQGLADLGLDDGALRRHGIRLLKLGMLFPLERGIVREFAQGLEELLVVEEKRGFIELLLREALYELADRPRIVGKRDEAGQILVPADGELDADTVARVVARRLDRRVRLDSVRARVATIEAAHERPITLTLARPPYFCSGCPHNRSTVVPEGSMAAAGIGCHGLAMNMGRNVIGITQMGGEGAQWVGLAPFVDVPHLFQQLGDGTLFHSGSLAIRQAVAAGTRMTFKILYNSAVAMTGGQDAAGAVPVPELTRQLEAEGVKRILVLTDEPGKYPRHARWAPGVEVWHRDRLDEAQRVLRDAPGVTVLIYDQRCAAEKRRLRKRGKLPDPAMRVVINELVCEGCGDCGVKSNCLSVQPVETEFGRKTQIHQSSCNKDYSCLLGDCPSFLTVVPADGARPRARKRYTVDRALPEPALRVRRTASLFLMGIGGTGVVTVNQILGTAALLDGKHVAGLDQTGLSQKGGPVVSHLQNRRHRRRRRRQSRGRRGRRVPRIRPAGGDRGSESPARPPGFDHRRRVDDPGSHGRDGCLDRRRVPRPRRPDRRGESCDPEGRERVRRRARPGGGPLRRPHGRQHDPAGRGLPGRGDPGRGGGDRAGDRDQRRPGRDERAGVPRGPSARRLTPGGSGRWSEAARAPSPRVRRSGPRLGR